MTLEHAAAALAWEDQHALLLAFERALLASPTRQPMMVRVLDEWTDLRRREHEARAAFRRLSAG